MENATKALLIAGSVLIVLLLIAIGLRIFNSTKGTTDAAQVTMNSTEAAMFNNKFTTYMNGPQNKSQVLGLVSAVIASNSQSANKIDIQFASGSTATSASYNGRTGGSPNELIKQINNSSITKYSIRPASTSTGGGFDANGYIYSIII